MGTRELAANELKNVEALRGFGVSLSLLFVTNTGLTKKILDATESISNLLKEKKVHNFDLQKNGSDNKIMFPCIILSGDKREETKVSLYRAATRGDKRFWPGRFPEFAEDGQVFALFIANNSLVLLNLSSEKQLDMSEGSSLWEILENIDLLQDSEAEILEEETNVEDGTSSEIEIPSRFEVSSYGWDGVCQTSCRDHYVMHSPR